MYAALLADDIRSPGLSYDDKVRFLRTLEALQPAHLAVLKALSAEPHPNPGITGSPNETLCKRLPQMDEAHIFELITQLNGIGVTNLQSPKAMMTGHGAEDLRHSITAYGYRFLKYLREP